MPHQAVHGLRELVHSLHVLLAPSMDARPLLSLCGTGRLRHLLALAGQVVVQDSCTDRWHTEALQCRYTWKECDAALNHSGSICRQVISWCDALTLASS